MCKKILIYIENNKNVSIELAKKAQELSKKLDNALVYGLAFNINDRTSTFFDKIYYFNDDSVKTYSGEIYSKIAVDLISDIKPDIVLIGATPNGRELAPLIASSIGAGLTADCISLDITDDGKLAATRPTFGGKLMATILSKTNPQMATVRPNVINTSFDAVFKETEYIELKPNFEYSFSSAKLLESIQKTCLQDISSANIIVSAGKGVKDNLDLVKQFADKIGASFAVSRSLVDMGVADSNIQVGQTGKTVCPKLYIAVGISGAIQHTVGIMGAKKIIAINKDKDAPIFKFADFGIVGDAVEILNEAIKH